MAWERGCAVGRGWGSGVTEGRRVRGIRGPGATPGRSVLPRTLGPRPGQCPHSQRRGVGPTSAPPGAEGRVRMRGGRSGCSEPKAPLPVRYPDRTVEAATWKEGPPNGKRLHHLPRVRTEPLQAPGGPASLFPARRGQGPLRSWSRSPVGASPGTQGP